MTEQNQNQESAKSSANNPAADAQKKNIAALLQQLVLATDAPDAPDAQEKRQEDFKFWNTQPVTKIGEIVEEDGPIEPAKSVAEVRAEPYPLPANFEWCEIDLDSGEEMDELYQLLWENYVEDAAAMFRFDYSREMLRWALQPPGWKKLWHIGVRVTTSKKLVAFIAAVPMDVRIYDKVLPICETNFLCVHKKLRSKRLAPVLIKELTRKVNTQGIFQSVYTAGTRLPTPVTTCRYYHRTINAKKLIETGFSHLRPKWTLAKTIKHYKLPDETHSAGFRPMEDSDVPAVCRLLAAYMKKFEMYQVLSEEEVRHYLLPRAGVIRSFVVQDPGTGAITGFVSYYSIPNTITNSSDKDFLLAAFLWFYAVEDEDSLPSLIKDALISAKLSKHDVFNCLDTMDNSQFLEELKFGPGDGYLNIYLFNWRCRPMPSQQQGFLVI